MSSLIGEAVSRDQKQTATEQLVTALASEPPPKDDSDEQPLEKNASSGRAALHSSTIERLQLQLDSSVIAQTKIRAVQDRTTASAIVETALRAYLKL